MVLRVNVKVQPWASRTKVEELASWPDVKFLKVWVNAKPIQGQANEAVVEILAKYFGVKKRHIKLLHGQTSRDKVFEIDI